MNILKPQSPFVWPEPRVLEEMCSYEDLPAFGELARASRSLFGIVSALTERGIEVLESWLDLNPDLKARLIVMVYPACATRQSDLTHLLQTAERLADRLIIHIHPLQRIADRATNALCFLPLDSDAVHIVTGPTEDLGLNHRRNGQVNFAFRADPALVEAFKRYFDWLWAKSPEITARGVAVIPHLAIPEGTEEGARLWREYMSDCVAAERFGDKLLIVIVDPDTGDVTLKFEDGSEIPEPTVELGLEKLDPLADWMTRLYDKGALVSIDKLSRIPPLDAPIDPGLFGDASALQRGNVTRKVSMRVSIIDEKTLKEIDKRRKGLRMLLTKFTYGLADSMRWMPTTAQALFESELKRINEEGQNLISDLLKGDVNAFINTKRDALIADINAMYSELDGPKQVTDDVLSQVVDSLKDRLGKAQSANFMPKLSYSRIIFSRTDNQFVSPWGQAFSLIADIAAFPRKALTDPFFFRGIKVPENELVEAMNVAEDVLCDNLEARGIKDRCKAELDLLARIGRASIESRDRCEMVWHILSGNPIDAIDETLKKMEA